MPRLQFLSRRGLSLQEERFWKLRAGGRSVHWIFSIHLRAEGQPGKFLLELLARSGICRGRQLLHQAQVVLLFGFLALQAGLDEIDQYSTRTGVLGLRQCAYTVRRPKGKCNALPNCFFDRRHD